MVESILILLLLHTEDRTKRECARTKAGAAIKETETLFTFFFPLFSSGCPCYYIFTTKKLPLDCFLPLTV